LVELKLGLMFAPEEDYRVSLVREGRLHTGLRIAPGLDNWNMDREISGGE
jgi:hypothetical protein